MAIVQVAIDVPVATLFDYLPGPATAADVGRRAVVPFGRKETVGLICAFVADPQGSDRTLKAVVRVLQDIPPLDRQTLRLLEFCAHYYHHPLGATIMGALPRTLRRACPPDLKGGEVNAPARRGRRRVLTDAPLGSSVEGVTVNPTSRPVLTLEQQSAVEAICAVQDEYRLWLLQGITGSGKTEVYLRALERTLARGRQVLYLVPEISLTPQLEAFLRDRAPSARLISLHSGIADRHRSRNWLAAQRGDVDIVLGTRLAVFTPMPRLGLIVVDEEHDASFKQQDGLRYSARDVAVLRAKQAAIPIVLGSATPALESFAQALSGKYRWLRLGSRPCGVTPAIAVVDTRREALEGGLSAIVRKGLQHRLDRHEQSLVFINRRGYAPALHCRACGWVAGCPRCSSRFVVHLRKRRLACHMCGRETVLPVACPNCGNQDLLPVGQGTQRVEQFLETHFPGARVLRVDRDSTRGKRVWQGMREEIVAERVDILVGTQMLAKGHDFSKLTLVVVLNADSALFSSDFRAAERLYAQLMQVAGRAGRSSRRGEVLIQTEFPEHPVFKAAVAQDYERFARAQLVDRRRAAFPPFSYQALLRAEAVQPLTILDFLERAAAAGRALAFGSSIRIYDPVPAPKARIAGRERAQLLVQSAVRAKLQSFLDAWCPSLGGLAGRKVKWSVDVDPLEL